MSNPKAKLRKCPICRVKVWEGLDGPVAAFQVRIDLEPVPASAEPVAVILGLRTYWLRRGRIDRREWWHIADPTGGGDPGPIHTEHRCGGIGIELPRIKPAEPIRTDELKEAPY